VWTMWRGRVNYGGHIPSRSDGVIEENEVVERAKAANKECG